LSGISGDLQTAKVRLKVRSTNSGAVHTIRFVSNDSWAESTIKYSNKPSYGSTIQSKTVPAVGQWIEFDFIAQANTELARNNVLSECITGNGEYVTYHSSEASNPEDRPRLAIQGVGN
jgi:hypothetical protein